MFLNHIVASLESAWGFCLSSRVSVGVSLLFPIVSAVLERDSVFVSHVPAPLWTLSRTLENGRGMGKGCKSKEMTTN